MKRRIVFVVILLVGVIVGTSLFAQQNQIVWKIAHVEVPDIYNQFCHTMSFVFKHYVEMRSGGRVKVEIYPAAQLGKDHELVEQVKIGLIQAAGVGEGGITPHYAGIQILLIPYLFKSETVVWEVIDGPFGQALYDDMAKKSGLRILSTGRGSFRNFTNNRRPIRTPADLKGIKFRTMTVPATVEMVKALGGSATPIPWPELYNALQMGVVDGQENPISAIVGGKLYEVQKHLTLDGHQYGGNYLVFNERWYQGLPPDLRKVVDDAARMANLAGRGSSAVADSVGLTFLRDQGMEVYFPTDAEVELFKKMSQPRVVDWYVKNMDPRREWVDKLFRAIRDAEKKLGL